MKEYVCVFFIVLVLVYSGCVQNEQQAGKNTSSNVVKDTTSGPNNGQTENTAEEINAQDLPYIEPGDNVSIGEMI